MALTRPRALQIFDLDYKQAVRAITTVNVTLSGGAPNTVDGVTLAAGDRILVNGQGTASQNGIYEVQTLGTGVNGTWVRSVDAATDGTLLAGAIVMVTEGTVFADTQWKLVSDNPIEIGSTALTWEQNSAFAFGNIFANGTPVLANTVGDTLTLTNGNNIVITGNATAKSVTIAVTEDPSFTGTLTVSGNATVGNLDTAGQVVATGNITGGNLNTAGKVAATGNISGGNISATAAIAAGTTVTATGNITGGNLTTAGLTSTNTLNASGNANVGNLGTAGQVVATGNVSGGNILTGGVVEATGNVVGGNVVTAGTVDAASVTATGNVVGGNVVTAGTVDAGSIESGTTITATGNITGGNLVTTGLTDSGTLAVTGNADVGNLSTAGIITATGNITGGNLITVGEAFSGTLRTTGDALINGNLVVQGNLKYINVEDLRVQDPVIILGTGPNGAPLTENDGLDRGLYLEYYTTDTGNAFVGWQNSSGNMIIASDVDFLSNDVIQVNSYGTLQAGNAYLESADIIGNLAAGNISTSGTLTTSGNLSANNLSATNAINAGTTITATGNITGGNIITTGVASSGTLSVTANANVGNLGTAGQVTATGNITGGNLVTAGVVDAGSIESSTTITATGNVSAGNVVTAGVVDAGSIDSSTTITATGNVSGGNLVTAGVVDAGSIESSTTITATGNVSGGNIITAGLASSGTSSVTGNADVGNLNTAGEVTATGNVTGGNLVTAGAVDAGSIESSTTITATGNVSGGNLLTIGNVTATGNIAGDFFIGNGRFLTGIDTTLISNGSTEVRTYENGNVAITVAGTSNVVVVTTDSLLVSGNISATDQVTATGNVSGGNLVTAGDVAASSATVVGNISGGNAAVSGLTTTNTLSVTANANVGNLGTAGEIVATGNITGGNLITGGAIESAALSVTGNVDAGNLNTTGQVTAIGNITGGNVTATNLTGTLLTASQTNITEVGTLVDLTVAGNTISGTGTFGNITISGSNINSDASRITVNSNGADVDFAIDGDTNANVFYVDAGTETVSIGNSTQTLGATLSINSSDSVLMPRGTDAERPDPAVIGMTRYNTEVDGLEVYTQSGWKEVGAEFTVIASEEFSGDDSTVTFTLDTEQTTDSCIVSINGIVQQPVTSYSVTGTSLTFTEAPLTGDTIEVRTLTTTTTVTGIANSSGNAKVRVDDTSSDVTITGDLVPNANVTFDLGTTSTRWRDLYLSGNSIILGDLVIKNTGGNTVGFFGPDGTTPGTIDSTNIDATSVSNGTSSIQVFEDANIAFSAGGAANIAVLSGDGLSIVGDLSVTGNATLTGNILGDRIQNGTTKIDIQTQSGNANITVGGVSNVAVFTQTGAEFTNVSVSGAVAATGNVSGNFFIGNGSLLTGIDATSIQNGTSNVRVVSANGNVTFGINGTGNVIVVASTGASVTGTLTATGNISGGNVSGTNLTGTLLTAAQTNITSVGTLSSLTVTGTVTGGNLSTAGTATATGNITGGNLITAGTVSLASITKSGSNGVGNIGQSNNTFNTVFARATSALYADLAEQYLADGEYGAGTVLVFGGSAEVTESTSDADHRVAGVVSTDPAYIMNAGLTGRHVVMVALTGRVPCRVRGPVRKGDLMVSTGLGHARSDNSARAGTVIGKALEDFDGESGVIEVVVGRH